MGIPARRTRYVPPDTPRAILFRLLTVFSAFSPADFAGGGPVHMTSGTAALIWSFYLGKRRGYGTAKLAYRPHSVSHVILGTTLIWFGWCVFFFLTRATLQPQY